LFIMRSTYDTAAAIRLQCWAVLLCLGWSAVSGAAGSKKTATGCPEAFPDSENNRENVFLRVHKKWPPDVRYPGHIPAKDTAAWTRYMRAKERNISLITERDWKWERWLEQAQIRILKNFTKNGWGIGHMPADIHRRVLKIYNKNKNKHVYDEGAVTGYISGHRNMVDIGEMAQPISNAVQKLIAKWARVDESQLVPTSLYGIREYRRDSVLQTHVDRVESHILSAVYVVDYQYDSDKPGSDAKPWYMVTDPDLSGYRKEVHVKPGQVFFYESAKLPHGRPSTLEGDFSAHVFIHFKPRGWKFKNVDRVYGLPPGWSEPPSEKELTEPIQDDTEDSSFMHVFFINHYKDGVSLLYIPDDEYEPTEVILDGNKNAWPVGSKLSVKVLAGNKYEARYGDSVLQTWIASDIQGSNDYVLEGVPIAREL